MPTPAGALRKSRSRIVAEGSRLASISFSRISGWFGSARSAVGRSSPSYRGLASASVRATRAASGSSRKRDTRCELALRHALWRSGLRYRVDVGRLPGRPDIVFVRARVAIFCDGDFWHGRDLDARLARLARGHNAPYWVSKIRTNVARDQKNDRALRADGWRVLRFWESEIAQDLDTVVRAVHQAVSRAQVDGTARPQRSGAH